MSDELRREFAKYADARKGGHACLNCFSAGYQAALERVRPLLDIIDEKAAANPSNPQLQSVRAETAAIRALKEER